MKKIILLFLVLFISFIYTASSLKVFEVEETEKLSLGIDVDDPDADALIYTFTEPLDNKGEWQTTYGDAGEYNSIITVSDGETDVSEEVSIIVNRKEAKPTIDGFEPIEGSITIDENNEIKFEVTASDLNDDILKYEWKIDDDVVSNVEGFLFETGYQNAGEYIISIVISDDVFDVRKEWEVNVNDVDLNAVLGEIEDVIILETETASLKLSNLKKYGLSYKISEPLGNRNQWKTSYDDAGEYDVKVNAFGKDFEAEKNVKIIVQNKDRPPILVGLKSVSIRENDNLVLEFSGEDPDNDDITFSVENIPVGATLDGNALKWKPGFDFVQKENALDYILDRFRLLSKSVEVVFIAQSNDLRDEKRIRIRVKDTNRPFVLEDIADIEVNEGEEIFIDPKYNDPDKDRVSFSYSGFLNRNKKKVGFDDAGEYIVKVIASDGFFRETIFLNIKVNDVNRKPEFNSLGNFEVKEGDELKIELSASDKDNDAISFSAEDLPANAKLKDNLFVWKPEFDVVNGTMKEFSIDFRASDGIDTDSQKVKITVLNANQAPKIMDFSDNLIAVKNEAILFEVNAVDVDGDELTYSWDFGFFSKFEDENQHQRVFTSAGNKKVTVTVSDGVESVSKVWDVLVV